MAWVQQSSFLRKYGRGGRAQAARCRWSCSRCQLGNPSNWMRRSMVHASQGGTVCAAKRLDCCKSFPQGTVLEKEPRACCNTLPGDRVCKWEILTSDHLSKMCRGGKPSMKRSSKSLCPKLCILVNMVSERWCRQWGNSCPEGTADRPQRSWRRRQTKTFLWGKGWGRSSWNRGRKSPHYISETSTLPRQDSTHPAHKAGISTKTSHCSTDKCPVDTVWG
jgi:hypothetical protein